MSEINTILAVLLLCFAANVSPGPNFALISRMAMSGRKPEAWGAALGMATAGTLYGILAMTGLSLLLQEIGWFSRLVQIIGGLYLLWLGIQSWTQKPETSENCDGKGGLCLSNVSSFSNGLRIGTIVDLANPKNIAFYVSLFAVAVPAETALWAKVSILAGAFLIEWLWYAVVIHVLSKNRAQSVYSKFSLWIERSVGSFLMLFGVKMIADR